MEQMTEGLAIADVINSAANNNTNTNSAGVDMSKGKRVRYFVISAAGIGAAGTIDGRLQSGPNSNFNVVHNLTGTNLTQINANNIISTVEVRADQVTQQNAGDRYVRLQLTGGGNSVTVQAFGLLGDTEQKPASQYNLNSSYIGSTIVCNT